MIANVLEIQIMPTTGSLYQRGLDIDYIKVEPGETFKIDRKFQGTVDCENKQYVLKQKDTFSNHLEVVEGEDALLLEPARYRFHEDGITIEQL